MPKRSNKTPRSFRFLRGGEIGTYDSSSGMWFIKRLRDIKIGGRK